MAEYFATVSWKRSGEIFTDNRYSRGHVWRFDEGLDVPASSSPHTVPIPLSVPKAVDPEEAFVASLSSCHMLFFLSLAAKQKFVVDSYEDNAVGVVGRNASGRIAMLTVTLRPRVTFSGPRVPTREEIDGIHHKSHELCYIANSVTSEMRCEPV